MYKTLFFLHIFMVLSFAVGVRAKIAVPVELYINK